MRTRPCIIANFGLTSSPEIRSHSQANDANRHAAFPSAGLNVAELRETAHKILSALNPPKPPSLVGRMLQPTALGCSRREPRFARRSEV